MTRCSPNEAPAGYYAIPKGSARPPNAIDNFCHYCDWRPTCQREDTDFANHNHRCMSHAAVTREGKTIVRRDGCSVVFLKRHELDEALGLFDAAVVSPEQEAGMRPL